MEQIKYTYIKKKTKYYELFVFLLTFFYLCYHCCFLNIETKNFTEINSVAHGALKYDIPLIGLFIIVFVVLFIVCAVTNIRGLSSVLFLLPIIKVFVGSKYYIYPNSVYYYYDHPQEVYMAIGLISIVCLGTIMLILLFTNFKKYNKVLKTVTVISSFLGMGSAIWAATYSAGISDYDSVCLCVIIGFEIALVFGSYKTVEITDNSPKKVIEKTSDDIVKTIKKYKELLDNGVITQEEYDKKKKEVLNF